MCSVYVIILCELQNCWFASFGSGGGGVSHLLRKEVTQSTAIVKYFVDGGIEKLPEHFILVSLKH